MDSITTDVPLFDLLDDENIFGKSTSHGFADTGISKNIYSSTHTTSFPTSAESLQGEMYSMLQFECQHQSLESDSNDVFGQLQIPPGFVLPMTGDARDLSQWLGDGTIGPDGLDDLWTLPQETPGHTESPEPVPEQGLVPSNPTSRPAKPLRRPRKQNHACDQCRVAKRACNFRSDIATSRQKPLKPCTTCMSRGIECTVAWLETKQASLQPAKRRSRTAKEEVTAQPTCTSDEGADTAMQDASTTPTNDVQLVRYFSARETCIRHFNLYVDVLEMPLSHFLLQGMMPRRYSLGVRALYPLSKKDSFRHFSQRANQWVNSCWDAVPEARASLAVAPHIFHTAAVLDSVFERRDTKTLRHPLTARDEAINRAHKWAALASAAQFSSNPSGDKTHCRDFAYATWQRAKQVVFENTAAIGSFRLALALVTFGAVQPPAASEQNPDPQEVSTYALCEGIKRLHNLCHQARRCVRDHRDNPGRRCFWDKTKANGRDCPAHGLPHEVQENLLELISAIEWLFGFVHAARTVLSRGKISPLGDELDQSSTGFWPKRHETTRMLTTEMPESQISGDKSSSTVGKYPDDAIDQCAVTRLWRVDAPESTMLQQLKPCGILSILQWSALARLTTTTPFIAAGDCDLDEIRQLCSNVNSIVKLYRASFGIFDEESAAYFQDAPAEIRRMAAMISNDCDLGVLIYYDMIKNLKSKLSQQPPSKAKQALNHELEVTMKFCAVQRLISAIQVSTFARSRLGASPGLQGAEGLKAQIQDLAAHPVSVFKGFFCLGDVIC